MEHWTNYVAENSEHHQPYQQYDAVLTNSGVCLSHLIWKQALKHMTSIKGRNGNKIKDTQNNIKGEQNIQQLCDRDQYRRLTGSRYYDVNWAAVGECRDEYAIRKQEFDNDKSDRCQYEVTGGGGRPDPDVCFFFFPPHQRGKLDGVWPAPQRAPRSPRANHRENDRAAH